MGALSGDIQVIIVDPVSGAVSFGLRPKVLTGNQKLVQIVVLALLNTPGKAILNPTEGGGLLTLVGSLNVEETDSTQALAEINRAVKKVQTEIVQNQTGLDAPGEELLKELQVISLTQGDNPDDILLKIRIINEAGRITDVVL
ncbi:MAG: hypothetical protein ACREJM_00895 [Candidatus Saccharimonadales bacterium]